jgi:hypothetical protein
MTKSQNDQAERREVLENDRRVCDGVTFHQFATVEATQVLGRFASISKPTVVGSTPAPTYPAAPNWSPDPCGVEPALGVEIDAQEPVGTTAEISASLKKLGEDQ